ncbi:SixA phosphatase family protein [Robertkochia sediminum]|uniref:SixA phosphatase family protein n=1 Tax=Robertkochia sediminum TaxID=2785326 RepID=UPI0019328904|nr:histidine phosphatase family protein [Robertkochia sediminum]MBL7474155.1 histidine phosphatase family protein [Robertkochia sediminum]
MRHGKSSWENDVKDQDRPLQERGVKDAFRVAQFVSDKMPMPEVVFSSPANRALHTCIIAMRQLGIPYERLTITDELYDFSGGSVEAFIRNLDDSYENVMIFGHNHAFTSISNIFGSEKIENLPTAGLVHIHFECEHWADIEKGVTRLKIFPKLLR